MEAWVAWLMGLFRSEHIEFALFAAAFISATVLPGGSEAVLAGAVAGTPSRVVEFVLIAMLGNALGGFLMGVLMSASGYVGGAAVQVDSAIMMIRVLASVAPLALMLVVAVILRFYTVDKQMPQIKQDLEARAAATTEAAAE